MGAPGRRDGAPRAVVVAHVADVPDARGARPVFDRRTGARPTGRTGAAAAGVCSRRTGRRSGCADAPHRPRAGAEPGPVDARGNEHLGDRARPGRGDRSRPGGRGSPPGRGPRGRAGRGDPGEPPAPRPRTGGASPERADHRARLGVPRLGRRPAASRHAAHLGRRRPPPGAPHAGAHLATTSRSSRREPARCSPATRCSGGGRRSSTRGRGTSAQYLQSLRRMREARPRVLYPGHGPTVFDAVGKITEYEAHRAMREEQVLDALAAARTGSGNWSRRSTRTFRWSSIRPRGCSSWRSWPSSNGSTA